MKSLNWKKLKKLNKRIRMNIDTEVAVMKKDLEYIKDSLDDLKESIKCVVNEKADKQELMMVRKIVYGIIGYTVTTSVAIIIMLIFRG